MTEQKKETVIVNLFAGPGAGKTTCAWEIAAELKKVGLVVEYVAEVAKEYVWDERFDMLDGTVEHQRQLFEEQNHRVQRLLGKVDVIVTDCPVLLYIMYLKQAAPELEKTILTTFKAQRNFNFFVRRGKGFEQNGRIHDLSQSIELDKKIIQFLQEHNIYFGRYSHQQMKQCIINIQTTVKKAKNVSQSCRPAPGCSLPFEIQKKE